MNSLRIEPLGQKHNRETFDSGNDSLNRYLLQQMGQDVKRHIAASFVLINQETLEIAGYYTLSSFAVVPQELHPDIAKRLPRYPLVPATLLGRLAVDLRFQGRGYGEILLMDALRRTLKHASDVATIGVVVEAINDQALAFYQHFEFKPFPDHPQKLLLPITTIGRLF